MPNSVIKKIKKKENINTETMLNVFKFFFIILLLSKKHYIAIKMFIKDAM